MSERSGLTAAGGTLLMESHEGGAGTSTPWSLSALISAPNSPCDERGAGFVSPLQNGKRAGLSGSGARTLPHGFPLESNRERPSHCL